ncbi:MAG: hypothetical protein JWL88_544 [Parcubacteria group bacterium]|nr:hypothetical protein [Parcubacteria group bacterium]
MLRALTLDERTKARMRDALDAYVDMHEIQLPVPARAAVPSPYASFIFSRMGTGVLAFVLLLLVSGTGAAYAAEGSVPGSPLYPVKVAIIEPVQGALITSAKGQAAWHANLASRRLEEATTLAVANKLDPATQAYLQTKFNTEVTASNEDADAVAVTGDTNAALAVRSDLEARITAHAEILAAVTNHLQAEASSTDATTLEGTKTLLAVVQARRVEAVQARLALENTKLGATATVAMAPRTETSAKMKIAPTEVPHAAFAKMAPSIQTDEPTIAIDAQAEERSSEVASILLKHASLLRAMAPIATTSTSTMATTTTIAATTTEQIQPLNK